MQQVRCLQLPELPSTFSSSVRTPIRPSMMKRQLATAMPWWRPKQMPHEQRTMTVPTLLIFP